VKKERGERKVKELAIEVKTSDWNKIYTHKKENITS